MDTGAETFDVPSAKSPTQTDHQAPPLPATLPRPPPQPHNDVSLMARQSFNNDVKCKYTDIFKVSANCDKFTANLDLYDDTVNVKGRLHLPSSIAFFEEIGASDFILKTLKEGHFPKLKETVPDFEFKNNAGFYKNQEFAEKEVKNLIEKGRVVVLNSKPKCVNPLLMTSHIWLLFASLSVVNLSDELQRAGNTLQCVVLVFSF